MRILFLGDVYARAGRNAISEHLQSLKDKMCPDVIIINGENAAAGNGITIKIAKEFFDLGADCITTGNHVWRQKEVIAQIDNHPNLLRPLNYPKGTPGKGTYVHQLPDGRKLLIVHLMGQVHMQPTLENPFREMDGVLSAYPLGSAVNAIFVDFHAEITSEKVCMGHHLDGRVSALLGTHTHIPTADDHILEKGTAYQSDVGMCGDYDSSIGTKKDIILRRFTGKMHNERFEPATGTATLCGALVVTNDQTGLAESIDAFQYGGVLKNRGFSVE